MALISLSWGFHPHPWAQKPHFSTAQGYQSLAELYWRSAALQLVHVCSFVSPWASFQTSTCRLTAWLDLSQALLLWTFQAITRPGLNPDVQMEFAARPQTCLIAMALPYDLDSWLVLAIISRFALLTSFRYCGWALVGEVRHCWPWGPITSWLTLL